MSRWASTTSVKFLGAESAGRSSASSSFLKGHTHSIQTCHLSAKTGEVLWSRPVEYTAFDFKNGIIAGVENNRVLNIYSLSNAPLARCGIVRNSEDVLQVRAVKEFQIRAVPSHDVVMTCPTAPKRALMIASSCAPIEQRALPLGDLVRQIETGVCNFGRPAIDPKGEFVAWLDADATTALLGEITTGKVRELRGSGKTIVQVAFGRNPLPRPVGRRGKRDGAGGAFDIDIWSAIDGTHQLVMRWHELEPVQVVFSSTGNYVVSAGWDRIIRIWSAHSGQELGRLPALDDPKIAMIATEHADHKGLELAVCGSRAERYVWPIILDRSSLVAAARSRLPRVLLKNQRDRHFLSPEPPAWCIEFKKWPYHTEEWQRWLADTQAGRPAQLPVATSRWLRV